VMYNANMVGVPPGGANPFRFNGMYWDGHCAEHMTPNRMFNPRTGRWSQPDPYWNRNNMIFGSSPTMRNGRRVPSVHAILQSGNLFMFTMHNPVKWADPSGLFAVPSLGIGGIFGPIAPPILVSSIKPKKHEIAGGGGGGGLATTMRWPAGPIRAGSVSNTHRIANSAPAPTPARVATPAPAPAPAPAPRVVAPAPTTAAVPRGTIAAPTTTSTGFTAVTPTTSAKTGRAKNHFTANPNATGAHTTYRTDTAGRVTHYETWVPNSHPKHPTGFDSAQRVDVTGRAHDGIATPHVHTGSGSGSVRPAQVQEVPIWAADMITPVKM